MFVLNFLLNFNPDEFLQSSGSEKDYKCAGPWTTNQSAATGTKQVPQQNPSDQQCKAEDLLFHMKKKHVSMRDVVMWCHNKCKCFSINLSIISKKFCIWRQYTHEQFCFDVEEKRSQQNKSHLNIMLLKMYGNNGNGGVICKRYVILLYHNDVYFFNRRYINADIGIYQWSRTKRRLNGVFVKNHNGVQSPYILYACLYVLILDVLVYVVLNLSWVKIH